MSKHVSLEKIMWCRTHSALPTHVTVKHSEHLGKHLWHYCHVHLRVREDQGLDWLPSGQAGLGCVQWLCTEGDQEAVSALHTSACLPLLPRHCKQAPAGNLATCLALWGSPLGLDGLPQSTSLLAHTKAALSANSSLLIYKATAL